MGKVHQLVLIAGLILAGPLSFAQSKVEAELLQKIETVRADLDNVQKVTGTITGDGARGTFGKIANSMTGSMNVLREIVKADIPDATRADLSAKLLGKMGETFFYLSSHHGIDSVYRNGQERPEANFKHNVLQGFKEILLDVQTVFTLKKDGEGHRVWSPLEQANRNRLTSQMVRQMTALVQEIDAAGVGTEVRDEFNTKLDYLVEKSLQAKGERFTGQKMARWLYLGLGVAMFLNPPFDLAIERTYFSTFASSLVYLSAFMTVAAIKSVTISGEVMRLLAEMKEVVTKLYAEPGTLGKLVSEAKEDKRKPEQIKAGVVMCSKVL